MVITQIKINNFKSWKDTGLVKLNPITGFFGPNSSGKTSLIQLLLLLKQTAEDTDREKTLNLGDENALVKFRDFSELIYGSSSDLPLSFSIEWDTAHLQQKAGKNVTARLDVDINADRLGDSCIPLLSRFCYHIGDQFVGLNRKQDKSVSPNDLESESYALETNITSLAIEGEWGKPLRFYGFPGAVYQQMHWPEEFEQMPSSFEKLVKNIFYLGPLREVLQPFYKVDARRLTSVGKKGENAIPALLSWRSFFPILPATLVNEKGQSAPEVKVAEWLKKMGLIDDFVIEEAFERSGQYAVKVKQTVDSPQVYITDVGFGISQFLPVLVLCFIAPRGSTLIFEQPEIHLHPSAQYWLADLFIEVSKERNLQIILESHSEHLLQRFQRRAAEDPQTGNLMSFYFTQIKNGASELLNLELDEFGNIKNWPEDFFGDEMGEMSARMQAEMQRKMKAL